MKKINIIGLGTGGLGDLSVKAYNMLISGDENILRTGKIPIAKEMLENSIKFSTFDEYFENVEELNEIYSVFEKKIYAKLENCGKMNYCIPGNPFNGDVTTRMLLKNAPEMGISINVINGQSFLDKCLSLLNLENFENINVIDSDCMDEYSVETDMVNIIPQVENEFIAEEICIKLDECYCSDHCVYLVDVLTDFVHKFTLEDVRNYKEFRFSTFLCILPIEFNRSLVYNEKNLKRLIKRIRGFEGKKEYRKLDLNSYKDRVSDKFEDALKAFKNGEMDLLEEKLADSYFELFLYVELINEEGYFNFYDIYKKCLEKYK